jgi:hypothetical protein
MAITFRGTSIPGIHSDILTPAADPLRTETVTAGTRGATEVRGQTGAREFVVRVTLFNSYSTSSACVSAIVNLEALQNTNGTLVENELIAQTFKNCTLLNVRRLRGPIPCTGASSRSGYSGWMAELELTFRQLRT